LVKVNNAEENGKLLLACSCLRETSNFQGDGLGPIRYRSPHISPLVTEEPEAIHQPEVLQQQEVPKDVRDPVGLGAACAVPILTGILFLLVHRWAK
jgi:hypothetical protein